MATVGLRDLFRARVTETVQGSNILETYAKPTRIARAIEADLSVTIAEAILYADDIVDEIEKEFVSGELKLKINDLLPAETAALLGQTLGADGVIYAGGDDDPPYFAIGFRASKPKGQFKYIWLYKVKFAIPSEKYVTKGERLEFNTPEIAGKFIKRNDGLWKAEHVGPATDPISRNWFEDVKQPGPAQG